MSRMLNPTGSERLVSSMKSSALLALLATVAAGYAQDGVVPERFPLDRYSKLMGDPPFAVKTDTAAPEPPKIDWAESLYLSGASKVVENGTEKDMVFINNKGDQGASFQLYGTEPNAQGIQIVELDWHPENPAITKVTLKKGTELATLERDKAAFTGPPPSAPQPPGTRRGQPPQTVIPGTKGIIRPTGAQPPRGPAVPRPNPTTAVPVPQPTLPAPAAGAQQQGQGSERRKIRVIDSR
jgi:hypothetical protein